MRCLRLAGVVLLAGLAVAEGPSSAQDQAATASVAAARDAVYPALVNIEAVIERFAEGRVQRSRSAGSGVIVTPQGHVLTNYHVAGRSIRISCTLPNGEVLPAKVLIHDPLTDLSVLQLDLEQRPAGAAALPFAELAAGDDLEVGDVVLAMGNPLALASSMTLGIVSNPARVFADRGRAEVEAFDLEDGEPSGLFTRWIQHDALILPGNSGGPLVDLAGRVVGINELGGSGIGFAIPASIARWVLEQTLEGGALVRGWIGITVQPVRALGETSGALIGAVQPESPAASAGLEPGDLLESLGGEAVDVRFLEQIPEFSRKVALLRPGTRVPVVVRRGDRRLELEIGVEQMEPYRGEEREIRGLGITAQEVTRPFAFLHRLPEGVLITGVRPGRPVDAARPRPNVGDVLLQLAGRPVSTLDQLDDALSAVADKQLLAEVWRAGERVATVIELKEATNRRWGGELPKAWLGVATQVLTPDLAGALGEPGRKGFRVTRVFPGTSAARSGLEVGDLIAEVDGRALTASGLQDAEQLRRRLQELEPGETAALVVVRGGRQLTLEVELEEEPRGAAQAAEVRHEALEVTVRAVALEDRLRELWSPDQAGVIVAEATTGGWAHLAGLRVGDLVQKVDGTVVTTPQAFAEAVAAALERGAPAIALLVRRGGRTVFVFIEPAVEEVL